MHRPNGLARPARNAGGTEMSRTKIYQFDIGGKCFVVQAEAQGVARFMLRMRQQGGGHAIPYRLPDGRQSHMGA